MPNPDVVLLHDDCIRAMHDLADNSIDFLLTDLPYGTTNCAWDTPIDLEAFWTEVNRVVKPNGCKALFAQTPFDKVLGCSNLKQLRYEWIWEKAQGTGWLNCKKNANEMPRERSCLLPIFTNLSPANDAWPQAKSQHRRT